MEIQFNLIYWLAAAMPLLVLLLLLMVFKWPALKAAPFAFGLTLVSSITLFGANADLILVESGKAMWSSLGIVLVVLTAIFLYEVSKEADAFQVLNKAFAKAAPNELLRIMLIGVVFSSFLQGVTGFGVPILVTAPLLMGIGVLPLWAVVIPLIGHCWAGTFGTLALAWHALILQTDLTSVGAAALYGSFLLAILNLASGFTIAWFYGGIKAIGKGFMAIIMVSLTQGLGQILVTQINPDLGVFIPSVLSAGTLLTISKLPIYKSTWAVEGSRIMGKSSTEDPVEKDNMTVLEAFVPYIFMTVITLFVLMVGPVNSLLGSVSFGPSFGETVTRLGVINPAVQFYAPIKPLTHASFFLALSAFMGYLFYRQKKLVRVDSIYLVLSRTVRKAIPSSIAILSLMGISRLMTGSGQTDMLAYGVYSLFGTFYSAVGPFVGLAGAFITSSNMSSNILFGGFQYSLAGLLDMESHLLLGAQTAGGSIGTSIAPSNVVLGATTAGILGSEGQIMKTVMPFVLLMTSLFGLITFIMTLV